MGVGFQGLGFRISGFRGRVYGFRSEIPGPVKNQKRDVKAVRVWLLRG